MGIFEKSLNNNIKSFGKNNKQTLYVLEALFCAMSINILEPWKLCSTFFNLKVDWWTKFLKVLKAYQEVIVHNFSDIVSIVLKSDVQFSVCINILKYNIYY